MTETEQPVVLQVEEQTSENARMDTLELLLREVREQGARQTACLERQLRVTRICAWAMGGVLAVLVLFGAWLVPQVGPLLSSANAVIGQAGVVLENLQQVSDELAAADLGGVLENADALVSQSREGLVKALSDVEGALQTIQSVDIETLNQAIKDLRDVVKPLANLFGGK